VSTLMNIKQQLRELADQLHTLARTVDTLVGQVEAQPPAASATLGSPETEDPERRTRQLWPKEDLPRLIQLADDGVSPLEIARLLKRRAGASSVLSKLNHIWRDEPQRYKDYVEATA